MSGRKAMEWTRSRLILPVQMMLRQKLQNHEIDGFVLNESPQWERDNISAVLLIGGSYNYFAVSKKRPDLKAELDQAMQRIEKENPFYTEDLYKRYLLRKFH